MATKSKKRSYVKRNTNVLGRGSSHIRGTRYFVHFKLGNKWHIQDRPHIGITSAKRTAKNLKSMGALQTKIVKA